MNWTFVIGRLFNVAVIRMALTVFGNKDMGTGTVS